MRSSYSNVNGFLSPKKLQLNPRPNNIVEKFSRSEQQININHKEFPNIIDRIKQIRPINTQAINFYDEGFKKNFNSGYQSPSSKTYLTKLKTNNSKQDDKKKALGLGVQILKSYNRSFKESKNQTKQIIQELIKTNNSQLSIINELITKHQKTINNMIDRHCQKLKEILISTVEQIFEESHLDLKQLLKKQQMNLNKQLYSTQNELFQYKIKLSEMKTRLETPQWKEIALEILESQIQRKISKFDSIIGEIEKSIKSYDIPIKSDKIQKFCEAIEYFFDFGRDKNLKQGSNIIQDSKKSKSQS